MRGSESCMSHLPGSLEPRPDRSISSSSCLMMTFLEVEEGMWLLRECLSDEGIG